MNKTVILAIAGAIAIAAPSCTWVRFKTDAMGQKDNYTEFGQIVEKISDADEFTFNLPADITYVQTDGEPYLHIDALQSVLDKIEIRQEGSKVLLQARSLGRKSGDGISIRIGTASLKKVSVNGAADLKIAGGLKTESFILEGNGAIEADIDGLNATKAEVVVNGAGDVELKGLDCGILTIEVNGAGDVTLAGRCDKAAISVHGAGDVDARNLSAGDIYSNVSGIGEVRR